MALCLRGQSHRKLFYENNYFYAGVCDPGAVAPEFRSPMDNK
jgi:hypothetical protein